MKKFDQELSGINQRLIQMAGVAQQMVALSTRSINDRRIDVQDEASQLEEQLDRMQIDIDRDAIALMSVHNPVAKDLRYLLVVTRVTGHFERIGDEVVNVCETLDLMQTETDHRTLANLRKMAEMVREMVHDAIEAFFSRDMERATMTCTRDNMVDSLDEQVAKQVLSDEVLHRVLRGTADIADGVAQILLARHLERIADQVVNVCEEVIYLVRGDDVRHELNTDGRYHSKHTG